VAPSWTRIAGIALLVAAIVLTVVLACGVLDFAADAANRRAFTSSAVVSGLILLALCGICWQAGFRLAFRRHVRHASLFSRPAWFAIGVALVVMASLMAAVIVAARQPTILDYQVILTLGGFGVWCIVLALRPREERRVAAANGDRESDERA
jgi:membrane protease YdiL (CAAX protease family)